MKAIVVAMLDEIAWLFNLRGSDIAYNPVFFAYAVVSQSSAILFVKTEQLTDSVRSHLGDTVQIRPYDEFFKYLRGLGAELELSKDAVSNDTRSFSCLPRTFMSIVGRIASPHRRQDESGNCRSHRTRTSPFAY